MTRGSGMLRDQVVIKTPSFEFNNHTLPVPHLLTSTSCLSNREDYPTRHSE